MFYALDAIISVGYRVNSGEATRFRIRATAVLKESLLSKNHSQLGFWTARQYAVGGKLMIKKWPQVYS